LSKTKNVPKLTSNISSSLSVICGGVSHNCTSGAGPTAPVADAPPASAMDAPTTPATGTAFFRCFCLFRCFCFVRGIVETSMPSGNARPRCPTLFIGALYPTPCPDTLQDHAAPASRLQRKDTFQVVTGKPSTVHKRASAQLSSTTS
jgi:hypothetical protein